jgi:hypothetical protein
MADDSSKNEVKVGHWYLCAVCPSCGGTIPIVEIEKDAPIFGDPASFAFRDVPCWDCGAKHDYSLASLQRLQAQERGRLN